MARSRLNREEFFDKLSRMDEATLKKALWTLYWRGAAPLRERIEAAIDPQAKGVDGPKMHSLPEADHVLAEVKEFASLARSGAYLAGDRRVSRQERSRWRHTFRRLVGDAQDALAGEDADTAALALTTMVDLACAAREEDYFRSEDPVEAARFVVSHAVAVLWLRVREQHGFDRFAEAAATQLLRWESRYGWTRRGDGWVAARETSLATVLSGLMMVPDHWTELGRHYLTALDRVGSGHERRSRGARQRAEDLAEWHALLVGHLAGSEHEELLDRLATHPALAGPERTFLQARLARERCQLAEAGRLVQECLKRLPGHPEFIAFANEVRAEREDSSRRHGA